MSSGKVKVFCIKLHMLISVTKKSTRQTLLKEYICVLSAWMCNSQTKAKPLRIKTMLKGFIFTRAQIHAERDIHTRKQISCFVVHIIDRLWDEQRRGKPIQSVLLKATKRLCTASIPQAVWVSGGCMVSGACIAADGLA